MAKPTRDELIAQSLQSSRDAGFPSRTVKDGSLTITESGMITAWRDCDAILAVNGEPPVSYPDFRAAWARSVQRSFT